MKKPYWVAFFSMTGSEIVSISEQIGRWPDRICTNKPLEEIDQIHPDILSKDYKKILFLSPKPSSEEYDTVLKVTKRAPKSIITLHGFLRVLPPDICNNYTIYNGHPGDIETYPQLKGFNPQHKAFNLKLKKSGSVIHQVTAIVDAGPILASRKCKIDNQNLSNTYKLLHNNSISLWVDFLQKQFNISK
jgi:folate-dependent phosphoribosylglycinamide formyltransferase PurN